ncbi:MAG: adenylate/guanylate cyclase domain-containing protein [Candidatus Riflebacteria bacterium]|nr:adenylate/guanylate cyclase domain-containing protein [Candidatus Riflebacteria bacterium]
MFFPVLLWLIPIIALNLGYNYFVDINNNLEIQRQKEVSQQEIEALASSADFSFRFAKQAGEFNRAFKGYAETLPNTQTLKTYIETSAKKIFASPFPNYDLFVFHLPDQGRGNVIYYKSKKPPLRAAYSAAFKYLIDLESDKNISGQDRSVRKKFLANLLNSPIDVDSFGTTQRGKASFSLYELESHRFLWDYFEIPQKGKFGFFLFCKNEMQNEELGRKIAVKEFVSAYKGAIAAFVPIFDGYGGAVYQNNSLANSKLFNDWIKSILPNSDAEVRSWTKKEPPNGVKLANYTAYTHVAKAQTHLSVILYPSIEENMSIPYWLYAINLFWLSIHFITLFKGVFLGEWPDLSLKTKFTMSYLLASVFPVSLLVITLYGYLIQYREAAYIKSVTGLQSCINEFDMRKAQLLDQYNTAFHEAINDEKLKSILKNDGVDSRKAIDRLLEIYNDRPQKLPIISARIFDEGDSGNEVFFSKKGVELNQADRNSEGIIYPVAMKLRENKKKAGIPDNQLKTFKPNSEQQIVSAAYFSMEGVELAVALEQRRSTLISNAEGGKLSLRLHDYIYIDEKPFCAITVRWDDQALDKETYDATENLLAIKNPEFIFAAYKNTSQGLELTKATSRHFSSEFLNNAKQQAQLAAFRNSYSKTQVNNLFFYALPSKRFQDVIIVGSGSVDSILTSANIRSAILLLILFLTILVVVSCNYISSRIIVDPISGLKEGLDEVAEGRLGIEIVGSSSDELGQLCHEFSMMVQGLREREKLATLISDQAVEAISKGGSSNFDTESFCGVALVSDIRNFTGACEKYNPSLITSLLNEHFAEMTKVISEQGGRIYKYIGDAIEAVFPEDSRFEESASMRAFNASSRMIIKLAQINKKRRKEKLFTYKIGIGLRYGEMHSGAVGSIETRLDYAILGEPLKTAAKLESYSVDNPSFPLVVDEYVCENLRRNGLMFSRLDKSEIPAYILSDLGTSELPVDSVSFKEKEKLEKNYTRTKEKTAPSEAFKRIIAGFGIGVSKKAAFSAGLLFVIFSGLIALLGYGASISQNLNSEKTNLYYSNLNLSELLKSEEIIKIAFENKSRQFLVDLEGKLEENISEVELNEFVTVKVNKYAENYNLSRHIIHIFDNKDEQLKTPLLFTTNGFSENSVNNFKLIATGYVKNAYSSFYDRIMERIFDESMRLGQGLFSEYFSRAFRMNIRDYKNSEGVSEYIFWDYLHSKTPDKNGNFPVKGYVLLTKKASDNKGSLKLIVDSFADAESGLYVAIKAKENNNENWVTSDKFPTNLIKNYESDPSSLKDEDYVTYAGSFNFAFSDYNFLFARKISSEVKGNWHLFISFLLIFCFLGSALLYKTAKGKTFVNRFISAKLWLALISVSVIPMITVFFLYELYLNEEESVRVSRKQVELQNFAQRFESVVTFSNPIGWKSIKDLSYSKEIDKVVKNITAELKNKPDEKIASSTNLLETILDSWTNKVGSTQSMSHFIMKEIIVSAHDWTHAKKTSDNVSEFGKLLGEVGTKITKLTSNLKHAVSNPATDLQNDLFVEASMGMVRSTFGEDAYLRLPHAISTPMIFRVADTSVAVVMHVAPNILNPDYTIIWMIRFRALLPELAKNYNNYQSGLSKRDSVEIDSGFRVFPVEKSSYGKLNLDNHFAERHILKKYCGYVSSSNLPVSANVKLSGKEYLLEAISGTDLSTVTILTLADLSPIKDFIAENRYKFYFAMFMSALLILLIANSVAKDILEPIKKLTYGMTRTNAGDFSYRIGYERFDELGVLCQSFDRMMRGLEEKRMMGKMLSGTAQKETLHGHENASRKADCVLLYVGVPDFSTYMAKMPPESLFESLKHHVAYIAGVISDEGGEIDKIIGDKQLIAFHPENRTLDECINAACKAALRISRAEAMGSLPFPTAVGVSVGTVVTGFLGVGEKRDFTVIGDTVNVAARIEVFAEKQRFERCLVSEDVYKRVGSNFKGNLLGEVELKGKSEKMPVYILLS